MEWIVNATSQPLYPRRRDETPIVEEAGRALGMIMMGPENSLHRDPNPGPSKQ
jgi:hypothetical protein